MRRAAVWMAVVMAAAVIAAGCSRGPSDEQVANDIKAKMFSNAELKAANLDITVRDGVATLAGEAPSETARYQAFKLASETAGVKSVEDKMTVKMAQAVPALPEAKEEEPPAPAPKPAPRQTSRPAARPAETVPPPPPPPPPASTTPTTQPATPAVTTPPPPPQPVLKKVELEAGTAVVIRMLDPVDSELNKTGEAFKATLDEPVDVDGETVLPVGTDVLVRLVESKAAGRMAGRSELRLELARIQFQGKSYTVNSTTYEQKGASESKRTAATVGGGAAVGAIIGGIAGGGKGAAIGAAVGAAGGTAVSGMTKGQQIRVPAETRLEFKLESAVTITYDPAKMGTRRGEQ